MRKFFKNNKPDYPDILLLGSTVGLIASFWQAAERIQMLKFPEEALSCNLSPVVDCGGVLDNSLAAIFGPPNAFIGMVVFSMLLALSIQRVAGGSWAPAVRKLAVLMSSMIFMFSVWFFGVSLYSIGKLCIFCIFIWSASMPIGIYGLKDFLENKKHLGPNGRIVKKFLVKNHFNLLIAVYTTMIVLFLLKFSDYYFG